MKLNQLMAVICIQLVILFPVYTVDALTISNLEVTPAGDSALVTWQTDEPSNSTINYGTDTKENTLADSSLVTSHGLELIDLESESHHSYDIISSYFIEPDVFSDKVSGSFWTKDATPPAKITGLVNTSVTQNSITLEWDKTDATDFSKYLVYRNDENIKNITSVQLTEFTDNNLDSSTTYEYEIAAMDTSSNFEKSDSLSVTTSELDTTAPTLADIEITLLTENQITIIWTTDEESNTTLYYGLSSSFGSFVGKTELTNEHSITATDLEDKKLYYYRVESCDEWRNCNHYDDSFVAGSDITKPFINITYPKYFNDYRVNITGFTEPYSKVVFYVNDISKGFIGRDYTGENGIISFALGGFLEGTNTFKILVEDGAGNKNELTDNIIIDLEPPQYIISNISSFSSQESLTVNGSTNELVKVEFYIEKQKTDITAPAKVLNLVNGTITENSAELLWDKNTEEDIKEYAIYRNSQLITSYQDNRFIDPGLTTDKEYTYQVSAVDTSCNEGPKSDPLTITTKPGGTIVGDSIEPYSLSCEITPEIINYTTEFEITANLQQGLNNIRILLTDLAGNSVEISKQVYFDKDKPSILEENIDELNPSYIKEITIHGKVSEEAVVFIILNDNGTIEELANNILNKTIADIKTIAHYSTETDSNGFFSIDIELRRDPAIMYGSDEQPLTLQSEATTASYWLNEIEMFAVDNAGLKSDIIEKEIKYALCGGGTDWQINIENVLPIEIVPRYLIEGFAQIGFNIKLEWQGMGDEKQVLDGDVRTGYPMDMSSEMKDLYDEDWISRVDDRWSDDHKYSYTVINFKRIDPAGETTYEKEENLSLHNQGKCFKAGLGFGGEQIFSAGYIDSAGCVKIPLTIEVQYVCEQYTEKTTSEGYTRWVLRNDSCTQKQCVDIDVMIQPRVPPSLIPSNLLIESIKFLNETIKAIDLVLEPLKTATMTALVSCIALWIVWFIKMASEFFSCIGVSFAGESGCYAKCKYIGDGALECKDENGDDDDDCKSCIESKLSTQKVWKILKWTCDRVMCPSVPSFEKFIEDNDDKGEFCSGKELVPDLITDEPAYKDKEINKNKIYDDIKTGKYKKDPQCKELLSKPLNNQVDGKCCDEYYMQEWDSGCVLMNELKESGCLATRDPQLCGAWGNIFRGVADFSLCYGNKTKTIETEVDGQWFIMEKKGTFEKKRSGVEEYDVLDNWELYLGQSERRIEKDAQGNVISESVKVNRVDKLLLKTESEECKGIMREKNPITFETDQWPPYEKTPDLVIILQKDKEKDETPATVGGVKKKIPRSIVEEICSGVAKKDYVVDPTSGLIRATQCACLSAVYAYLKQYREILNIIRACFQTILITGDGSAGVCKAVISYYICDLIYYAIKCIKEYSGAGYGREVKGGISGFIQYVTGSGGDVINKVSNRYGDTNLFRVMFVEKKVLHAVCLFAFTGDWDLDLESLFTSATTIPIKSTVGIAPSTRRFMSYDTITGYSTHIYHIGTLIVSGADNLRYRVQLICSADNSCSSADGYENGICDCAHSGVGGEQPLDITGRFGTGMLDSGETLNEEEYIQTSAADSFSRYRYDKAKITYTYLGNDGQTHTEEKTVDIRQIGGAPPAECKFDLADLSFKCGFFIGVNKGDAWFDEFEADLKTVYKGQKIPFYYVIELEGERDNRLIPKHLTWEIGPRGGTPIMGKKKITKSKFESTRKNPTPEIRISDEHFRVGTETKTCKVWPGSPGAIIEIKKEESVCGPFSLMIKYDNEKSTWAAYSYETSGAYNERQEITSCSKSGLHITCGNYLSVKLAKDISDEDREKARVYLTQDISTTTTKSCEEGIDWTATFSLHYPKVDSGGNLLENEVGNDVVYDGVIQKRVAEFKISCEDLKPEEIKPKIEEVIVAYDIMFKNKVDDPTDDVYIITKEQIEDNSIYIRVKVTSDYDIYWVKLNRVEKMNRIGVEEYYYIKTDPHKYATDKLKIEAQDEKEIGEKTIYIRFEYIDDGLTETYSNVIKNYLKDNNPENWKIDSNGNFICVNKEGCYIYDEEGGISYSYLETFPPPGGYYEGKPGVTNQREENIKALDELKE